MERERTAKSKEVERNKALEEDRFLSHGRELDALAALKRESAAKLQALETASAANRERDTATLKVRLALEKIKRLEEERAASKMLLSELQGLFESREAECRLLSSALRESESRCKLLGEENTRLSDEVVRQSRMADAAKQVARQSSEVSSIAEEERDSLLLANSRLKTLLKRLSETALSQGVILPSTVGVD